MFDSENARSSSLAHRPDIDGLRAFAVVPVVLYHAGFLTFSGGFVGVDVFFVISGYLITSLLAKDLESDKFSLLKFWERRVRRILPASFVTILTCLIIGWFLLGPAEFKILGNVSAGQVIFISNFIVWQDVGYFDTQATLKPLLHTWSLSVEEQYYFLIPLILWIAWNLRSGSVKFVFLLIWTGSLLTSVIWLHVEESGAFYLLPSRMWELMTGSLLALSIVPFSQSLKLIREFVGWGGLFAIIGAVILFDENTPFPGLSALVPCLGASAVIWSGIAGPVTITRFLGQKLFVWIGLVSYSLYLWHWPIIVFSRIEFQYEANLVNGAAIISASLAAAWLSYRFVELPFRRKQYLADSRRLFFTTGLTMSLLIGVGGTISATNGAIFRFDPDLVRLLHEARKQPQNCREASSETYKDANFCIMGPISDSPKVIVWGDSHAGALKPIFKQLADRHSVPVWLAAKSACLPLPGVFRVTHSTSKRADCDAKKASVYKAILDQKPTDVILVGRWAINVWGIEEFANEKSKLISDKDLVSHSPEDSSIVFRRNFMHLVTKLNDAGMRVWVVRQVPLQPDDVPNTLFEIVRKGGDLDNSSGRPISEHNARQEPVADVIDEAERQELISVIDPAEILCSDRKYCRIVANGRSLYRDEDHLSISGALEIAPLFEPIFNRPPVSIVQ